MYILKSINYCLVDGNFTLEFIDKEGEETLCLVNHLDRQSLKELCYFINEIVDDWALSLSDYEDDEILKFINEKLGKFVYACSISKNTHPWIVFENAEIEYNKLRIYDKCVNLEEIKDWYQSIEVD